MSTSTLLHPLAADYLVRLRVAVRALPREERQELIVEIEAHLNEATRVGMSNAAVLSVIDRLGDPDEIVGAQQPAGQPPSPQATGTVVARRRGAQEWAAIFLVMFGGVPAALVGLFLVAQLSGGTGVQIPAVVDVIALGPVSGWIAGLMLMWTSDAWTRGDKLLGTLAVPDAVALASLALIPGIQDRPGPRSLLLLLAACVCIASGFYLAWRAGRTVADG